MNNHGGSTCKGMVGVVRRKQGAWRVRWARHATLSAALMPLPP